MQIIRQVKHFHIHTGNSSGTLWNSTILFRKQIFMPWFFCNVLITNCMCMYCHCICCIPHDWSRSGGVFHQRSLEHPDYDVILRFESTPIPTLANQVRSADSSWCSVEPHLFTHTPCTCPGKIKSPHWSSAEMSQNGSKRGKGRRRSLSNYRGSLTVSCKITDDLVRMRLVIIKAIWCPISALTKNRCNASCINMYVQK